MIGAFDLGNDGWRAVASAAHWHGMAGSFGGDDAVADDVVGFIGRARMAVQKAAL